MTTVEKIKEIEAEMARTQKNKATSQHLGLLKAKLAKLRRELLTPTSAGGGGPGLGFDVAKTGVGRIGFVGFPSVGKSTLMSKLTGTHSEVAAYEFTTLTTVPGVVQYNGAKLQILDLPGIIEGAKDGKGRGRQVIAVARTCSLIFLVLDVMKPLGDKRIIEKELEGFGIRLNQKPPNIYFKKKEKGGISMTNTVPLTRLDLDEVKAVLSEYKIHNADISFKCDASIDELIDVIEGNRVYIPCLYVLNKIDQISIEELDLVCKIPHTVPICAHHEWNFDELLAKAWEYLDLARIYTKPKGQLPDYSSPVVLRRETASIEGFCNTIHKAILPKHNPQKVGKEHILADEDVVQIIKKERPSLSRKESQKYHCNRPSGHLNFFERASSSSTEISTKMRFSSQAIMAFMASLVMSSVTLAQDSWQQEDVPSVPQVFKISNLLRTLDLSKPLIKEITSAAVLNVAKEDATEYYFPVDSAFLDNLAFISAENRKTKENLEVIKDTEYSDGEYQYYKIKLSEPLAPGEKTQITIAASFSNSIRPFPTHIVQGERQFFLYFGNPFALTAYPATKQKTTVITPNSQLEVIEHPEEAELVIKNNQVILGPYNEVKALEHGIFEIQYQLTGAVPYVSHLRRDIEVSQWGNNLAVEEHYKFVNKGAELKGHFSRIDLQLNPMSARESNGIMALMSQIPKLATEIYYRDEIGNISTSTLVQQPDHIILTFRPRFPIFGGWNTTWYTGYNVPLDGYLRVAKSGKNILKVPVFVPLRFTTYGDIEVRVVLPEGSKNVNVHVPFEVEEIEHSNTKTYMDSAGRHTITIRAKNLIEEHAQDMLIEYELDAVSYLTKPIAAAVMLMIVFATSIVYSRLDFRIGGSTFKK
ncbi:hypothetical protein BGZ49_000120 [Haplosporangium sp. Z 27]|nr:hypothetical protein BGZ49_000120 [Haplosporangium sp. Z 27]